MPESCEKSTSYTVGYRKPPKATQFKSGQSGNTKGRPKGSKNFAAVINKELNSKIPITENGNRKQITKREAIAKQLVNKAAGGDPKAMPLLLNETRFHGSFSAPDSMQHEAISPEDQLVMNSIMKRWQQMESAKPAQTSPAPEASDHKEIEPPAVNKEHQ